MDATACIFVVISMIKTIGGEEYILAMVKGNRLDAFFGQAPGWLQLQSNLRISFKSNSKMNYPTDQSYAITNGIENKAYYLRTNSIDASVYSYQSSMQCAPLPISVLGTKYIVSSCHGEYPRGEYTSLLVIVTHSRKTNVSITFSLQGSFNFNDKIYSDGDTLTLTLDCNQTFTIKSKSDLSGSVINTKETVAVFSGTLFRGDVVAYDQLLPVSQYGREYVVAADDHRARYQLQILSAHNDTEIRFNNEHTLSVNERRLYRRHLKLNESLYFTATKPVMATLCRGIAWTSGFLLVPPIQIYRRESGVYLHTNETMKVLTEQDTMDIHVITMPNAGFEEEWQDLPGSMFKVGTFFSRNSSSYYISSNTGRFAVLVYRPFFIYNGGYNFSSSCPSGTHYDRTSRRCKDCEKGSYPDATGHTADISLCNDLPTDLSFNSSSSTFSPAIPTSPQTVGSSNVDLKADRFDTSPTNQHWTIASACTLIVICVCLAVIFPYLLWRRRVVFLMKLVHRFQTYEDKDEREFDAFISYRSTEEDEHFVVHTLFPKLEKELNFKICVHFRDFMPGETIANNIIWGVESSRRTIMVLTPSYIKSEFCRFEYQRAQHEMLKQKQRIIPIIFQDISEVKNDMDETLLTILSSITYIDWPGSDDKRKLDIFWDKLVLSMPKLHRNRLQVHRGTSVIEEVEMADLNDKNINTDKGKRCKCSCMCLFEKV